MLILLYTLHGMKQAPAQNLGSSFTHFSRKQVGHILRQRAFHGHRAACSGAHRGADADAVRHLGVLRHPEGLLCAVQCLPPDAVPAAAVEVIPGQRMADGRKVHPDLVGAAGHRHAGGQAQAVLYL